MPQQLDLSKFQPSLDLSKFQLDTSKFEQPKENWWDWLMKKPITTVPGMLYQLSAGISQPKSVSEFGAGNINSLFTPANIALTAMSGGAYGLGRMGLTTGASVLNKKYYHKNTFRYLKKLLKSHQNNSYCYKLLLNRNYYLQLVKLLLLENQDFIKDAQE